MNQEEIYDEKVSPLVKQIVEICKEHKMPCIMSFACPNDEPEKGELLRCTTALQGDEFIGDQAGFPEAVRALYRRADCFAITVIAAT